MVRLARWGREYTGLNPSEGKYYAGGAASVRPPIHFGARRRRWTPPAMPQRRAHAALPEWWRRRWARKVLYDARTGMPAGMPAGAMCVQRFDDSLEFCNSHYVSHFAAFFIDARAKRSVAESCGCFSHKHSDASLSRV